MSSEPYSLYIHIPFCIRKCRYCDFYSVPYDTALADDYVLALGRELELICRDHPLSKPRIGTVFFGGGTPSLLSKSQWKILSESLAQHVSLTEACEWTVECNPDSFSSEKALVFLESGVTRITFGIQSTNQKELSLLGRVHSRQRIFDVLHEPILERFNSVGVDCMFGIPGQTMDTLNQTLDILFDIAIVKHLSMYELAISDTTPFGKHRSLLPLPDEDTVYEMTTSIIDRCTDAGFEHYEISNFARKGYRCQHNEAYWDHKPYIGLGTSSHSYVPPLRYAHHNNLDVYINCLQKGLMPPRESEFIDAETIAREMIFLGIRRQDGIDENTFQMKTGMNFKNYADSHTLSRMVSHGLLVHEKSQWKPTRQGMLIADAIARDLIRFGKTD